MSDVKDIIKKAVEAGASDIHLVEAHRPAVRRHTKIIEMDYPVISAAEAQTMAADLAGPEQMRIFEEHKDVDFSYQIEGVGRFRINIHRHLHGIGIALRIINETVPPLSSLRLPQVVERFTHLPRGLFLVTGETGSGKSTTLAAMLDAVNQRDQKHIITLEDPIEYTFTSQTSVIEQRELGRDTPSFASGLRHVLRQDPDVILVGEMRDLETASAAMSAAETGHFVMSTLHTNSAESTVNRIIDMYPATQQNQVRSMLSNTLQGVLSQTLFRRKDGQGMVAATEVMIATGAVRNLIREERTFEIPNIISTSRSMGMMSLDASIAELYFNGWISRQDALSEARDPARLAKTIDS